MIGNEASSAVIANDDDGDNQEIEVNAEEMFELFLGLFGESPLLYANEKTNGLPSKSESPAKWMGPSTSFASAGSVHSLHTDDEVSGFNHQTSKDDVRSIYSLDSDTMDFDGNIEKARRNSIPENESSFMQHSGAQQYTLADIDVDRGTPEAVRHSNTRVSTPETLPDSTAKNAVSPDRLQMETIVENGNHPSPYQLTTIRPMVVAESAKPYTTASSASPKAAKKLAEALEKLRQVNPSAVFV